MHYVLHVAMLTHRTAFLIVPQKRTLVFGMVDDEAHFNTHLSI